MKNKKTIIFIIVLLLLSLIIIYLLANKKNNGEHYITGNEYLYDLAIEYLKNEENNNKDSDKQGYHFFISYDKLGTTENKQYKFAYMWILGESYYIENKSLEFGSGYSMFFKFTFENDKVIKYENPMDGNQYVESIKKLCIDRKMYNKVINHNSKLSNKKQVNEYYARITY